MTEHDGSGEIVGTGEVREAIYDESAGTWVVGDRLAMQGAEGCRDIRCTRINGRCGGWHCPRCGAPCSSQGHDCPSEAPA